MRGVSIKISVAALLALIVFMTAGLPAQAIMLVSRKDEVAIGKQVEENVIKEFGGLSTDKALIERVERVGKQVAAQSERQDVEYTFKVLNSDVINAFAAPGGPVLITKKLAQMLSTDDELAFVLAHETGHITAQHGRQAINRALLAQGVLSLALGKSGSTVQTGVGIAYTLFERGYSRDQEYQADSYGLEFMTKAKYNAEGAITALAKLGLNKTKGLDKYLTTHPDVPDRINRIAERSGINEQRKQTLIQSTQPAKTEKDAVKPSAKKQRIARWMPVFIANLSRINES